ncbi:MAG: GIY-YIG nuclease family protein [Bacteroidales bacterium]|nr:GIY-YIG nuclease family protein [Bacteroidales bacterium]
MIITIQELLNRHGLDAKAKVKLVRHKDNRPDRFDAYDNYRHHKDEFLLYQASQSSPVFHGVDYIVSFIGEEGNRARFVGVYKIIEERPMDEAHRTDPSDQYYYVMEEVVGFGELKERVIIQWNNPRAWCQWYKNEMDVIEVTKGFDHIPFTGYLDFIVSFDELKEIVTNQYEDWKNMLSCVYGVYAIRDTKTNRLYIGSAYGKEGIWQRWETYVKTGGHGGNKTLKALVDNNPGYSKYFTFTLLMITTKSTPDKMVIDQEQLYKHKLGAELCNN